MNKETRHRIMEHIGQPIIDERGRDIVPRYRQEDVARDEGRRLNAVRGELAGLTMVPIVTVIVPAQQPGEVRQVPPPESLGEAVLDLLFGLFGVVLTGTGEFLESLGEKK
jgi:hypothetical protein